MRIHQLLKRILKLRIQSHNTSVLVNERDYIESFIADPKNTFLISFPRTGSHWLRMLMELYFGRPSLVRVFYYPERNNYLTLHTHDLELDVERERVIYLYRDAPDTIYSQLRYYKEDINDRERISYWSDLYGRHLDKWLHSEKFSTHKTILTYQGMKRDLLLEFSKVTQHFGQSLDHIRLKKVALAVSKDEVRRKTTHDPQVIQLGRSYEIERQEFRKKQGSFVWDVLTRKKPYLTDYFGTEETAGD